VSVSGRQLSEIGRPILNGRPGRPDLFLMSTDVMSLKVQATCQWDHAGVRSGLFRVRRSVRAFAVLAHPQLVKHADTLQIGEIARTAHFAERALINSCLAVFLLGLNLLDHS